MTINTAADFTSSGSAQQIASASKECRRLWLTAIGVAARFGDANVGAAQGVELPVGIEVTFAASDSDDTDTIHLDQCYLFVPSGSTVTVSWGS
jgi:hypothetical protein